MTAARSQTPDHVVVMGVSGSGKTTLAEGITLAMGWEFAEGDSFHAEANVAKMRDGRPHTDEDRWPWLEAIGARISAKEDRGESAVVTCSALRRAYRDVLRRDRPHVRFLHVTALPHCCPASSPRSSRSSRTSRE